MPRQFWGKTQPSTVPSRSVAAALSPRGRCCHLSQEWALLRPWAFYQEIVAVLPRDPGGSPSSPCPSRAAFVIPIFWGHLFDDGFPREDLLGGKSKLSHQLMYFPQRVLGCLFPGP